MFAAIEKIRLLARIVKVSVLRSTAARTMATGGVANDAGGKRKVALITGITGQVSSCMFLTRVLDYLHEILPWRLSS